MKKLIIMLSLVALVGCASVTPRPPTLESTMELMVAIYIDVNKDSTKVTSIANNIIAMAQKAESFDDIERYLVAEFINADVPFTVKFVLRDYVNSIISNVKTSARYWPDSKVYDYIIQLATNAKEIASMYAVSR